MLICSIVNVDTNNEFLHSGSARYVATAMWRSVCNLRGASYLAEAMSRNQRQYGASHEMKAVVETMRCKQRGATYVVKTVVQTEWYKLGRAR
eukprot:4262106-Pyramimonas_sp.AAC.1